MFTSVMNESNVNYGWVSLYAAFVRLDLFVYFTLDGKVYHLLFWNIHIVEQSFINFLKFDFYELFVWYIFDNQCSIRNILFNKHFFDCQVLLGEEGKLYCCFTGYSTRLFWEYWSFTPISHDNSLEVRRSHSCQDTSPSFQSP